VAEKEKDDASSVRLSLLRSGIIDPRYPVYVISKGRADCCMTAKFLQADGVPFKLVIEKQELEQYRAVVPEDIF